jgi:gamma-glutamyltranspeptidase / glutathione hydrolase
MAQELVQQVLTDWRLLARDPGSMATFIPGGVPYRAGPTIRYPALARTLRRLAEAGPDDFYRGQVAREIAADMAAGGGHITADDLAAYRALTHVPALESTYRGVTLRTARTSAGGVTVMQALQLLEGFDLSGLSPESATALHLWDQTMRLALMDRAQYLSDPRHVDVPFAGLLHPAYAAERRALLRLDSRLEAIEPGNPWAYEGRPRSAVTLERSRPWEPGGTQHVNVVDRDRNMVTLTDTVVGWSGVVLPRTGIVMNNAMTWHDPVPGRTSSIRPRSRGLNNMSPMVLLRDGRPWGVVGARGGRKIIQTVAQVISHLVDHGDGPQAAVSAPHTDASEPPLRLEARIDPETRAQLERLGHSLAVMQTRAGAGAGAIVVDHASGHVRAGEDPSGESAAMGW